MSLYVVEREDHWAGGLRDFRDRLLGRYPTYGQVIVHEVMDCNARDGEWHAVITMPHEIVEHEGRAVPAFEGDVERLEYERSRHA